MFEESAKRTPQLARNLSDLSKDEENYFDKMRRLEWIRENCTVTCPHCYTRAKVCFRQREPIFAVCRSENCHQPFDIFTSDIYDKNGVKVTESYSWPV